MQHYYSLLLFWALCKPWVLFRVCCCCIIMPVPCWRNWTQIADRTLLANPITLPKKNCTLVIQRPLTFRMTTINAFCVRGCTWVHLKCLTSVGGRGATKHTRPTGSKLMDSEQIGAWLQRSAVLFLDCLAVTAFVNWFARGWHKERKCVFFLFPPPTSDVSHQGCLWVFAFNSKAIEKCGL